MRTAMHSILSWIVKLRTAKPVFRRINKSNYFVEKFFLILSLLKPSLKKKQESKWLAEANLERSAKECKTTIILHLFT